MTLNEYLGRRVRRLRKQAGLSQTEFAKRAGGDVLSQAIMSRLERGDTTWNSDHQEAAAKVLRVDVSYLMAGFGHAAEDV